MQTALEDVLGQGVAELSAKGAVGILMEADTGQIRALASLPDFDPNLRPALPTRGDPADSPLFNRAAQGRYELGSTFKPLTVAMALEAGIVSPADAGRHQGADALGALHHPRLPQLRAAADRRGRAGEVVEHRRRAYRHRCRAPNGSAPSSTGSGCSTASPVELTEAGRTAPLLPQRWTDLSTITISYGHGMAVTPLHLAAAYATLVNGGLRVRPSIIEGDARAGRGRTG